MCLQKPLDEHALSIPEPSVKHVDSSPTRTGEHTCTLQAQVTCTVNAHKGFVTILHIIM